MNVMTLNETPLRTSKNFHINNIKIKDIDINKSISPFNNIKVLCDSSKIKITSNNEKDIGNIELEYGISEDLTKQALNNANNSMNIEVNSFTEKKVQIEYNLDNENRELVSVINVIGNENSKAHIVMKYNSKGNVKGYNNLLLKVQAKCNSDIKITIVNMQNFNSNNFVTIENNILDSASVEYQIIDLGGKNSITNFYSNLSGKCSNNVINTIYLGSENQVFDLNYIAHLRGERSNIDIEVQGALKENSKKHFKGTIDFKKGCKKSKGNENESCLLLSNSAKSIALPMLLCSEEDVEGNHSCSAGKLEEKQLFYIMSRGFNLKEAQKLIVKAKFNKIIEKIQDEKLKEEILNEIDKRLN